MAMVMAMVMASNILKTRLNPFFKHKLE